MSQEATSPKEQRKFTRLELSLPGSLKLENKKYRVRIQDISLKGALIEQEHGQNDDSSKLDFQKNSSGHLVILADPEDIPLLELDVQILRNQSGMIGLTWPTIDLDNLTQLREILIANLANEELIDRDLIELFHTD
ncbi:PilZ domain-containing protein [Halothiobacillus neapolitanus]|uniref:Type IV pilus assembly PilZ n=1 Tax=Halothiobacillus neapolitanus (strain ATCC 23641 / DSM 15147 / CIP 104769 / NCIMB 8539 / c2) TaxID=555778 RepID=D0L0A1_HALNC|nr:PilZ domain-containing protein [Halothiobacillus neapolitanus]ACX96124.1 type IV pilus assembly PilZ [Halothiobacillus neapolitanus c2]TDN66433.1 PilZ domain-containing protein [Halothiobacillus neapolitanus]